MDEPYEASNAIPDIDLSNEERASLASLIMSPAWKVLTEKVWTHLRRMAVTTMVNSTSPNIANVQGYYAGLKTAEFAVIKCAQPPKPDLPTLDALESKLTPRNQSGGML